MGPHDRAGPRVAGWSRLSARFAGLPLRVRGVERRQPTRPEELRPPGGYRRFRASPRQGPLGPVSTRKLIIAALLCGVAILVAGTFLLVSLSTSGVRDRVDQVPPPTTTTTSA